MFGDLLGNMEAQQAELQKQLKTIPLKVERDGIIISGNAGRDIHDIEIAEKYFSPERKEELQDLLIAVITDFNNLTDEEQAGKTQSLLDNILPGGMGGMFGQ